MSLSILREGNASEQPLPHQATATIAPLQATDENASEQVLDNANGKGTPQNMCSMIPPSTRCAAPLMPEAASEARNTVADATSSGRRKRCSSEPGSVCVKYAFTSSSLLRPADTLSCSLLWPADTLSCVHLGVWNLVREDRASSAALLKHLKSDTIQPKWEASWALGGPLQNTRSDSLSWSQTPNGSSGHHTYPADQRRTLQCGQHSDAGTPSYMVRFRLFSR